MLDVGCQIRMVEVNPRVDHIDPDSFTCTASPTSSRTAKLTCRCVVPEGNKNR